ncbi:hypothetical protein KEJ24_09135 [Candidatus Bathyarchaeota archaeon]|nr:hypothetical protein [Candidatus Bathyarchaeota archaeon]
MKEDCLNVMLNAPDVLQKLAGGLKISNTDEVSFIEAYLYDAHVRVKIEPRGDGSQLRISYDFTRYWLMLTLVTLLLIPIFLVIDKFLFGKPDPHSIMIPLIMLFGWALIANQDEKKKREKILKKITTIVNS